MNAWRLLVGGTWIEAASGAYFSVIDPATGDPVAKVPDGGRAEMRRAIDAASEAFPRWAALPALERGRILLRLRDLMVEHQDELARLITQENGKPFAEAKREVAFATAYFAWFAEEARRTYGEIVPSPTPSKRLWVLRQPIGVVAAITPWNFPATMVTRKIAPALAAGCTVVLKPASATPLTALMIGKLFVDAGGPAGVLNIVVGRRSTELGGAVVEHPAVRKIAFTGSTDVGKRLMAGAAQSLKRVSFELGGNAPFIVFDDADLDAATDGAITIKFLRVGGQSCICANRLYIHETIADRFLSMFIDRVRALRVAPGFEDNAQIGPLINEDTLTRVSTLVDEAVAQGAKVAVGGRRLTDGVRGRGIFYAPTVLTTVHEEMGVAQEEIFGPIAPVFTFRTDDEVIARANHTAFGLAAYCFTRDLRRAIRVAEALEYGMIGINDATGYTHEIPFGGMKESGLGREGGREGLEEYLETKAVSIGL